MATKVRRPNPFQWVWYAWGGRLPQRYREWVLGDLTRPGWLLRHVLRALVYTITALVPVLAIVIFVAHAHVWIALAAVPIGIIVGVYYSVSWAWESADAKLMRYGYPAGHATEVREAAEDERDREVNERYNAQWRHVG
jgi:membrane-associated phospholipid phosphatase